MNENKFLSLFREVLEMDKNQSLKPVTRFRELEEWDSLSQLSLIAMLDDEYAIEIETEDLDKLETVRQLMEWIESKE